MTRIDYYHDPSAPEPNSMVPSVTVAVQNETSELLLIHRTDNDLWSLPGGAIDLGESPRTAAIRETDEETGYHIDITELIGIYTDPNHVMAYDDGEVRVQFSICMRGVVVGGQARTSSESKAVTWVTPSSLNDLSIHPSIRLRIEHALDRDRGTPYFT